MTNTDSLRTLIEPTHAGGALPQSESAPTQLRGQRLRVVVADDSPTFIEVLCALLELDHQIDVVARVGNGAEAIETVAKLRPDAVLMDVDIPILDGLNAAMVISSRFPGTRIVLMSVFESSELRADAQACGAVAFIDKTMFRDEFPQALGIPTAL